MHRTRFLVVFLIAAAVALWVHDDGVFTSTFKLNTEVFAVAAASTTSAKPAASTTDNGVPEAYAMQSLGSSASPTMFEHGNRKNLPAPQPKYLLGRAPDPQRLSVLLQLRAREELWLACETRKEHALPCPSVEATGDVPIAWTDHDFAPVNPLRTKKKKAHI